MTEILEVDTELVKPAQTEAPVTEPSGWMSPTGEIREGAPEKVHNLMEAKKWNTVEQVVDSYLELEKFKGMGEHLVIPEAEDVEGWNKVFNKIGRPETHDKYELNYDGDVDVGKELIDQFKQYAHGLGLTQNQFNDVVKFQLDAIASQDEMTNTQVATQKETNIQKLKQKWGEENYPVRIRDARIIADSLGIYNTLEAKGLASDPEIIEMLDTIKSRTAEDVIAPTTPMTPTKSPQERLEEIKKSEAFTDKFHNDHKKIMAEYMQVNQDIVNSGQARQPRL